MSESRWFRLTEEQKEKVKENRRRYNETNAEGIKLYQAAWYNKQKVNLCQCGCGELVWNRWAKNHNHRISDRERFWSKVNKDGPIPNQRPDLGPCWLWTGKQRGNGYGVFLIGHPIKEQKEIQAHLVSFEWAYGPIDRTLQRDHLCRVRNCVRPSHIEQVTQRENILRGAGISAQNARKTHCLNGHEFAGENLIIGRKGRLCRICTKKRQDDSSEKRRAKKKALLAMAA